MPRIVQITDCHLFSDRHQALRGIVTWPRFTAVLDDIRRRVPEVDLLVVSGDSAHDESLATYQAVHGELADWIERVRIIPGNHDQRQALRDLFCGSAAELEDRVAFLVQWNHWQVIGLDSHRPGELPGSLETQQLNWLSAQLAATPHLDTILFLHHPPVNVQSPWLDKIGLLDAAKLANVLQSYSQVRLVVCGHVHQELTATLSGVTVVTTPAVGPQFKPRTDQLEIEPSPPAYRIIELQEGGNWSTQVMRLNAG